MNSKAVELYRMDMIESICPSGLKAKSLLEKNGIDFIDHKLTSREEVDIFKAKHDVQTTPQIWIDGERIGGFDALKRHLGIAIDKNTQTSYKPIIVLFSMTALMAMAASYALLDSILTITAAEWFIAFSMCALALQKLQNIKSFADEFILYDLLAQKYPPYAKIYPFAEAGIGIFMIGGVLGFISIPVALFIGGIGIVSVFKAVYINKDTLRCACVGGDSNVPLGFVSLLENIMMVLMALWMIIK